MRLWSSTATKTYSQPMFRARCVRSAVIAMADLVEAPQLLDVDVQQFTRHLALIALHTSNLK
jgi:hypothetical protein